MSHSPITYSSSTQSRTGPPTIDLTSTPFPRMTPSELLIWHLISEGLTTKQIASRLHISPNTVKHHRTLLYSKLNIHNLKQAILLHMSTFGYPYP